MPPGARGRGAWAWNLRRVAVSALAGTLAAVARPWAVVRVLAGLARSPCWPFSVTVVLVPAEWRFARQRYAWHQAERVVTRWRLSAGLVVITRRETAPIGVSLGRHMRALDEQLETLGSTADVELRDRRLAKRRRP